MLGLIFAVVVIGLIAWALITYVPMPQPFQGLVIILALLLALSLVLGGGGLGGLHLGHAFQ